MPTPTLYLSSDSGAPVIDNTAGSLVAALHAILVTGYGAKPAAGWTRPYSGTNKAVFRQAGGYRRWLRIDDDTGDSSYATARLYANMSSVDDGTGQAPTGSTVMYFAKANGVSAVAWVCLATANTFYLMIQPAFAAAAIGNGDAGDSHIAVGDLADARPVSSPTATFMVGSAVSSTYRSCPLMLNSVSPFDHYMIGDASGLVVGGVHRIGKRAFGPGAHAFAESGMDTASAYPDPSTGKLPISRFAALEYNTYHRRGIMPGLWYSHVSAAALTTLDTFSGSGALSGRTFVIVRTKGNRAVVFETSGGGWT